MRKFFDPNSAMKGEPRIPSAMQMAEKGDIRTGKEIIGSEEGSDEKYESLGITGLPSTDPGAITADDRNKALDHFDKKSSSQEVNDRAILFSVPPPSRGTNEIWIKKRKEFYGV